jgi:predicted DNA-binding helix-hairpin-helix protein
LHGLSGYILVNAAESRLPEVPEPPMVRENRLYQADGLMRLYTAGPRPLSADRS